MSANEQPRTWRPRMLPPMWLTVGVVVQWLLHELVPGPTLLDDAWMLGLVPMAIGFALDVWGSVTFARARTGIVPGSEATTLVRGGPYRFTRNPMYVGMSLLLVGTAMLFGTATGLLVPVAFVVLIDRRFVRHEEALLRRTFGEAAWTEYASATRRWL